MKLKNLSIVFGLLGLILLGFSSCSSDDDDNDKPIEWGGIAKTYTGANLKVNDTDFIVGSSIRVEGTSAETAKVVLTNLVVGEPQLGINATLNRSGDTYTLDASNSNEDREVSVKGTIVGDKMVATVVTKIKSPIVGSWALKDSLNTDNVKVADMIVDLKLAGNEEGFYALLDLLGANGEGLAKAVEYVNVSFNENGTLDIKFKDNKSGLEMSTSELGLNIYYYTNAAKNKVYIAINKEVLKTVGGLIGTDIDLTKFIPLFEDAGNFYAVPLNYKNKGNYTQFYISKDYILKIVGVIQSLGVLPEDDDTKEQFDMLKDLLLQKESVANVGLGFNKK